MTIVMIMFLGFVSCEESNGNDTDQLKIQSDKENAIVINSDLYQNSKTNNYEIKAVSAEDNTLTITISASGCDGKNFVAALVDASVVMESYPIQRNVKFVLDNKEDCDALINKSFPFDISKLKGNHSEIVLNLAEWTKPIRIK